MATIPHLVHEFHSKPRISSAGSGSNAPRLSAWLCQGLNFANLRCVYQITHWCHKTRPVSSSEVLLLLCAMWPTQTCPPQQPAPLLCPLSLPQIWGLPCPPAIAHCSSAHLNCSEGTGVPPTPCYCRQTDDLPETGSFYSALN